MKYLIPLNLILCFLLLTGKTFSEETHVHGVAKMQMIQDGEQLFLEFTSPAVNLFGFEHAPKTALQKSLVSGVTQKFQEEPILTFLEDACIQNRVEVSLPHWHSEDGHSNEHADFHSTHYFACTKPIETIQMRFFTHFPKLEKVKVEWVIQNKQGYFSWAPQQSEISIR